MLDDEAYRIATFAASEALVNFLSRRHSEGWGFFVVEWAKSQVIYAAFFQAHKTAYYFDDVYPGKYLLYGLLTDQGV